MLEFWYHYLVTSMLCITTYLREALDDFFILRFDRHHLWRFGVQQDSILKFSC